MLFPIMTDRSIVRAVCLTSATLFCFMDYCRLSILASEPYRSFIDWSFMFRPNRSPPQHQLHHYYSARLRPVQTFLQGMSLKRYRAFFRLRIRSSSRRQSLLESNLFILRLGWMERLHPPIAQEDSGHKVQAGDWASSRGGGERRVVICDGVTYVLLWTLQTLDRPSTC